MQELKKVIPIVLLSGFLGAGKTTFLLEILDQLQQRQLKPAILLNELGEVHVEGEQINHSIPRAELLGGCICCTSKGDLTGELHQLVVDYSPDIIIVEATGVAHPFETIEAVTELSLYSPIQLCEVITLVDSPQFMLAYSGRKNESNRLMKEQIACASRLILNKQDLLDAEQSMVLEHYIRDWNKLARIHRASRAKLDDWSWLDSLVHETSDYSLSQAEKHEYTESHDCHHEHGEVCSHHAHHHVMSYTHYWKQSVDSEKLETWLKNLPKSIYRAKGIVTFSDLNSRYLFQFAYRETDFVKIDPQGKVLDVAVFIGEHFDKAWLKSELTLLEDIQ